MSDNQEVKTKAISIIIILIIAIIITGSGFYVFTSYLKDTESDNTAKSFNINLFTFNSNYSFSNSNINIREISENWLDYDSSFSVRDDEIMKIALKYPNDLKLEFRNSPNVLNIYSEGDNPDLNLENSEIFINFYNADEFLVQYIQEINSSQELSINEKSAKSYTAVKKDDPITDRPSWLATEHRIVEILVDDRVYTIDFNPNINYEYSDYILDSISFY